MSSTSLSHAVGGQLVKMADVAAAAGVSITTVSHVLSQSRPVSPELQRRVREAVAASGYTPNSVARALATQSTMLIGVVMSFLTNPFFAPMVSHIERTARRHGYTLLLTDSHERLDDEVNQIKILLDRRVDGLILAAAGAHTDPVLDLLTRADTPTVLVDRLADQRFDEVGVENSDSTASLVTHLVEHGHRRIGLVSGRAGLSTTKDRLNGYRLGLEQAGLPFERALVRSGGSNVEPAQRAVKRLLDQPQPPTALITANDAMTVGVLRGLRELGARVPDDIAIVAFDDIPWGDLMNPGLTAIAQPIDDIGRLAANLLLRRIRGYDGPPERHALAPRLHRRQSCGCPPRSAPQ